MQIRTRFLARLIGIYSLVVALSLTVHKAAVITLVGELVQSPPILLLGGLIALLAGLAMVLAHNIWAGGVTAFLITLIGWLLLARGLLMVFISPSGALAVYEALRFAQLFPGYVSILFLLGGVLTAAGFRRSITSAPPP